MLGSMRISYDGVDYGTVDLVALNDVSASWLLTKEREAKEFFSQTWVKITAAAVAVLAVALIVLWKPQQGYAIQRLSRPEKALKRKREQEAHLGSCSLFLRALLCSASLPVQDRITAPRRP